MRALIVLFLWLAGAFVQAQDARGFEVVRQATPAEALRSGQAYALIIGTDEYTEWPKLANPVHDAQAIADELKTNFGYAARNVDLVLNPTVNDVDNHLRALVEKSFGPDDSLLIFVAGHGKFDEALQQGYLVFKDSKKNDPLSRSYMRHSELTHIADRIKAKRILVIIDACFGGTIDDNVAHRGADTDLAYPEATKTERLASRSRLKTRLYLTSGSKEYVSDGRPGANSPFAAQILRAFRNYDNTGLVTFYDLLQKADLVKGQTPVHNWFGSSDTDADFWFVKSSTVLAKVTAPAAPAGPRRGDDSASVASTPAPGTIRMHPFEPGVPYVFIPPGEFLMGCSPGDIECGNNEKPQHKVRISRGFWLGQTEMTQEKFLFQKLTQGNPSYFKGADLPVETISWAVADYFCGFLGARLPTEAEWEYAARAGSTAARYGDVAAIGWYGGDTTHPVKSKLPNAWGLYDMLGNVGEWVADWYDPEYYVNKPALDIDPNNQTPGQERVRRGGSWKVGPRGTLSLRASSRNATLPERGYDDVGFRCVRENMPESY